MLCITVGKMSDKIYSRARKQRFGCKPFTLKQLVVLSKRQKKNIYIDEKAKILRVKLAQPMTLVILLILNNVQQGRNGA